MNKKLSAVACAVALAVSTPNFAASDTSSSIRGIILNPTGNGAPNTTITIRHEPTGSEKVVKPNDAGSFVVSGLRVGGPYTIVIDSDTYQDKELTDVYLEVGSPLQINEQLLSTDDANKVVITASRSDFRYPNSGSSSVFSARDIENSPSFGRDIKDVLRRNPLVNIGFGEGSGMSIAGNNPRFNSISVDGVRQDDDFGLGASGYPTLRSPVSIDAIEQVSIATNPFNAAEGGFTGGKISLVTKSGTNDFEGSAFFEKADGDWTGDPKEGSIENLDEQTWGFGLGGPIIEDKLFYYFNYENYERNQDPALFPEDGTRQEEILEELISYTLGTYGFNAGRWDKSPVEEDQKILLKIDYDINEFHRMSFTYQNTDGEVTVGWPRSNNADAAFDLSSNWYTLGNELTSFSAHWYADWTENFSTEIKVTSKESDNLQKPLNGTGIGSVSIAQLDYVDEFGRPLDADGNLVSDSGNPQLIYERRVNFGPDRNRHANNLFNDMVSFNFDGQYLFEEHTLNFGWQHEELDVFNIFVPDSLGTWEFDSIGDYYRGLASGFAYQNADTNNSADAAADFEYTFDNFYIQDTWDYSLDLQFMFGVRFEHIHSPDRPRYNARFVERYGFANNESLDGETLWLPRMSLKYTGFEDLELRAGGGIFSGGHPRVWMSNAFTNDGVTIVRPLLSDLNSNVYLNDVNITEIPQEVLDLMESGDGNTTAIDPNFDIPKYWQYSFAADWINVDMGWLGEDWDLSGEVIYKDNFKDVRWVDLARGQLGETVEGRPIYGRYDPVTGNPDHYDILMTNGDGGESLVTTLSAFKSWDNGVKLNVSYTNQDVEQLVAGSNSTAESSYQYTVVVDRQNPQAATASYQTEHALKVNLDYSAELFEGYKTHFNLYLKRSSGRPYSWVMGSFRDGDLGDPDAFDDSDSYLPYIPSGADDPAVDFVNGLSYEEIVAHLQANGISTRGGYLQRNAYRSPWNTVSNLAIRQEIPGFTRDHKGEFYFTIENLLNLLDSSKGDIYYNRFGDTTQILFDYDINEDGQYVYDEPFGGYRFGNPATYRADKSVWRLKAGFKYKF
ncbi:TonB-dependent receptor [Pleionea sediminis]|uniref:TonB-dependent receptor n=1 Tax=Pleionea sediminis TaxID=2569479 RepID=UPI00197C9AF0|nr:TonB-dependent receptor [Pleionea sediminis]